MSSSSPITVVDSPGPKVVGQGTASNPILLDSTPVRVADSPVKVVPGEKYRCVVPYFCEYKVYNIVLPLLLLFFIYLFFCTYPRNIVKSLGVISDCESSDSESVDSNEDPVSPNEGAVSIYSHDDGETWNSGE